MFRTILLTVLLVLISSVATAEEKAKSEAAARLRAQERVREEANARLRLEEKLRAETEQRIRLEAAQERLGVSEEMATCDCCGRDNVGADHLVRIDSGQLFCADCLVELRG